MGSFDGRIQIQTRNSKYGLLKNGTFVKVDSNNIRQMKNHIVEFFSQPAIRVIFGCNGYVWIDVPHPEVTEQERYQIAVLRNALTCLDRANLPLFKDTLIKVIEEWQLLDMPPKQMLQHAAQLTKSARELIDKEIDAGKPVDVQKLMAQIEQGDFAMKEE